MECPTPRLNLYNVNNGLWVIMMFRCRFINCHKCAPLVGDVNSRHHSQISGWWQGGLCMCVGKGSLCAFPSILLWIWNCFSKVLIKLLLRETYRETWYIQNTKYILMVFSKVRIHTCQNVKLFFENGANALSCPFLLLTKLIYKFFKAPRASLSMINFFATVF